MNIEIADMISLKGEKYITLDVIEYQNKKYAFMNKLDNEEEPTSEYYVFTPKGDDDIEVIADENLMNTLIPIFQDNLKKELEKIMNEGNE